MLVQGKDGELRIYEWGVASGSTLVSSVSYYFEVLFCTMDFTGPTSRTRTEETMIMNRGKFDSNAHYVQGSDESMYAPLSITFSCKLADTVNTRWMSDIVSGVTKPAGVTQFYTWAGHGGIHGGGVSVPAFVDTTGKMTYRLEMEYDGTTDLCYRYDNVYFTPGEQTITEAEDGITLSCNGQVYGDVTSVYNFSTGWSAVTTWT